MPSSRTKRALAGYLTSVGQYGTQFVMQAFIAPLILALAGREVLGAYAIIYQTLAYLALMDLGLAQALERYLAQCIGRADGDRDFREIFGAFRSVLLVTNVCFAALVLAFAASFQALFSLSPALQHQARVGLLCIAGWALLRTPFSAFVSALIATQELARANIIGTISNAMRLLLSVLFLKLNLSLLGLMWAALGAEIFAALVSRWMFLRKFPSRAPVWNWNIVASVRRVRGMISYSANTFLVQLTTIIVFNSSALVAGWLYGPVAASVLYTTQLPGLVAYNVVCRLHDNFGPALNELWGSGDEQGFRRMLRYLSDATGALSAVVAVGVLLFNQRTISAWVGSAQYAGLLATIAVGLAAAIYTFDHLYGQITLVLGSASTLARIACVHAALYVPCALVLGKYFGVGGILLAGPLTDLVRVGFLMRWVYRRTPPTAETHPSRLVVFAAALAAAALVCALYFRSVGAAYTRMHLMTGFALFGSIVLTGSTRLISRRSVPPLHVSL